jgi:hypothetical protein
MPKKVHSASYSQTHLAYLFPLTETPKWNENKTSTNVKENCKTQKESQSHFRPEVPRGFQEVRFKDYVTMAQDGGKVVSLMRRPLFTSRK